MSERIPGESGAGWDNPEEDDREAQGEDPTSPERGFEDLDDLENYDEESEE
ncbi:MAG: hypothetical protein JO168_18800 [Solirubrobacterales bacterium]|nr:hypothetical protein [Solirubrobacterales bacterium]MBV9715424.1 hypothetical protein [Solirubrobacterales bacterium]